MVTVSVVGAGTNPATAADFTASPTTVTIPRGEADSMTAVNLQVLGDTLVEGDETLMVTGEAAALSFTSASVTLTITDDDSATVTLGAETVNEGVASGMVTITATLTGEVEDSFEVMVSTTDGTAGSRERLHRDPDPPDAEFQRRDRGGEPDGDVHGADPCRQHCRG